MLSLPVITPRDSHELWFGPSNEYYTPTPTQHQQSAQASRQNGHHSFTPRAYLPSRHPANSLAALAAEERALALRKQSIACFGYSWIKPAGCAKTMLGMKEEEMEREEALAAARNEMAAMDADDDMGMTQEEDEEGMERDLDDDIPDADVTGEAEGLIEEGEEGLEESHVVDDEEAYLERDLDDEIPEAQYEFDDAGYEERDLDEDIPEGSVEYGDGDGDEEGLYEEEVDEDFDNQPDLDADVPSADEVRDLDDDIPDAAEDGSEQEGEWQHTDTEEELDDDDDDDSSDHENSLRPRFTENFRTSTPNSRGGLPLPPMQHARETDAQRRFLNRWSGGGDVFDSSSLMESDDLRASVTSQGSRRSGFGRRFPRHVGGPRDSLN
ncbi:hypothetical protein N7532_009064 [Penicillium argentinense]|uniref:Anaphase-promoting complex, subunit 15/MND2 n=1 Tax=Penicillium argentinense TaxID=1131581 RepID=A0A9W9EYS8_9EURO|nr:uncharacterized protein N7532_009064 [Penicillium argentinense]KAJ5090380.1 hypothetical protein N7532_009064 [Penicillium argentinense]